MAAHAAADGIDPALRPFNQWLLEQRGGSLHGELTERLAELAAAVTEHEKAGSITLTISVRPSDAPGVMVVSDDIKSKVPEPNKGASLFHTDEHGNMTRSNPRQPELPLREVPAPGAAEAGGKQA